MELSVDRYLEPISSTQAATHPHQTDTNTVRQANGKQPAVSLARMLHARACLHASVFVFEDSVPQVCLIGLVPSSDSSCEYLTSIPDKTALPLQTRTPAIRFSLFPNVASCIQDRRDFACLPASCLDQWSYNMIRKSCPSPLLSAFFSHMFVHITLRFVDFCISRKSVHQHGEL
jgi:hypothetical protein